MPTRRRLKGRTIAALAADGFEKVELIVPLRALKTAGARVEVVSLRRGRIRGVNLHMPASRVRVDKTIGEADPGDYDGLLLPAGSSIPTCSGSPPRPGHSSVRSPRMTSASPSTVTSTSLSVTPGASISM